MGKIYDDWERLVSAVARREKDRQLALSNSFSSASSSQRSFSFTSQSDLSLILRDTSRLPMEYSDLRLDPEEWKEMLLPDKRQPVWRPLSQILGKLKFKGRTTEGSNSHPHASLIILNGKKCYMIGARELGIIWCGDTPEYWDYASHPDSRFSEVALLKSVFWLEIRSTINTRILSPNTVYGAYLVYKLDERCFGLESTNAFVRFKNDKLEGEDERKAILDHFEEENARARDRQTGEVPVKVGDGLTEIAMVHLQKRQQQQISGRVGVERGDGWMEVELGKFFCDGGDDGEVETWLMGAEGYSAKAGLLVQGVEFRPKDFSSRESILIPCD